MTRKQQLKTTEIINMLEAKCSLVQVGASSPVTPQLAIPVLAIELVIGCLGVWVSVHVKPPAKLMYAHVHGT